MDLLRITFVTFALFGPVMALATGGIYTFVNAEGELYLSNVPDDERYQMLDPPAAPPRAEDRAEPARPQAAPDVKRPYSTVVNSIAVRYGIEEALLHAVISVESGYNARAVSKAGAAGLMQLMPETAKRYGVADIFDPHDNIRAGAHYLRDLLKLFNNDLALALAAYNAGEGAVLKHGRRIPPYRETVAYVPRVLDFYQRLRLSM
jgi:soluble lytic murein transglycosylase-like protein